MTKIGGCSAATQPPRFVVSVVPPTIWRDFYGSDSHDRAFTEYFEPGPWTVTPTLSERIVTIPPTRTNIFGIPTGTLSPFVRDIKLAEDDYVASSPELSRADYDLGGFWRYRVFFYWEDPRANEIHPPQSNPFFPDPLAGYIVVNVFQDSSPVITDTFMFGNGRTYPLPRDYALVNGDVEFTSAEMRAADEPQIGYHQGDYFSAAVPPPFDAGSPISIPGEPALAQYNFLHLYSGFSTSGDGQAGNTFQFTGQELQFRFTVRYSRLSRPSFYFLAEKAPGFC